MSNKRKMTNANEFEPIFNPLLIDVVVDMLFKYLSFEDFINKRRVCKLWQRIGLTRLKYAIDEITISFNRENSIEKFLQMAKGFSFKFTNFAISYLNDGSNDDANPRVGTTQQTIRLFNEYGTHMKSIELNLCDSTDSWTFLSDVLMNKAPNVEQLHLERYLQRTEATELFSEKKKPELRLKRLVLVWQEAADDPLYSNALLADLFACSPYLESLLVFFDRDDLLRVSSYGVTVLQSLDSSGNISNLKELSLNVGYDDIFEILATSFKYAPLETFGFGIYEIELGMLPYIETFFADHKDTLNDLSFSFPCAEFPNKFQFPIMKNLEDFCICGLWCHEESEHEHRHPFGVFNFGKLFPNLRTLRLCESANLEEMRFFNLDEIFPKETTPVLKLKNLGLPPISNPEMLRRIGRIFPNVLKMVVVPQTPDILKELWTTWPEIKTLHIILYPYPSYLSINLDTVFTGVDGSDNSRNFPSIGQLRKLKHLRISKGPLLFNSASLKDLTIKDDTVRLALADLKELVFLQISEARHEISPSCVQQLCTELGMLETEMENKTLRLVKYEWQNRSGCPTLLNYE